MEHIQGRKRVREREREREWEGGREVGRERGEEEKSSRRQARWLSIGSENVYYDSNVEETLEPFVRSNFEAAVSK